MSGTTSSTIHMLSSLHLYKLSKVLASRTKKKESKGFVLLFYSLKLIEENQIKEDNVEFWIIEKEKKIFCFWSHLSC